MTKRAQAMFIPLAVSLLAVGAPALGQMDDDTYGDDYRAGDFVDKIDREC